MMGSSLKIIQIKDEVITQLSKLVKVKALWNSVVSSQQQNIFVSTLRAFTSPVYWSKMNASFHNYKFFCFHTLLEEVSIIVLNFNGSPWIPVCPCSFRSIPYLNGFEKNLLQGNRKSIGILHNANHSGIY